MLAVVFVLIYVVCGGAVELQVERWEFKLSGFHRQLDYRFALILVFGMFLSCNKVSSIDCRLLRYLFVDQ